MTSLRLRSRFLQHVAVVAGNRLGRDARDARHHVLDLLDGDELGALVERLQALARAGLVDHVDRLVRQVPVVDVAGGKLRRRLERVVGVLDAVVLLEPGAQAAQDLDRLGHRGLDHVDLLEAARERVVLLEDAAVFLVGGRADAAQLAIGQRGLDQVGGIHHPAGRRAGADHGVDLVDEQDRAGLLLDLGQHALQPLLEIAAVLGAGDQRAQVERVHGAVGQHVGHLALDDQPRQAFDQRGLADARLAHVQRVVLAAAAEDLHGALDLERAADQRVDAAFLRQLVEVGGVLLERGGAFRVALALGRRRRLVPRARGRVLGLGQAVRDEIDDVEAGDLLQAEQVGGVRVLLAEDRDQHVGDRNFLLAARLHVEHGPLQHALEAERGLHLAVVVLLQPRRRLLDEFLQLLAQPGRVRAAGAQDLAHLGRVDDGEQQVLDRHEFMAGFAGTLEGLVEADLEFAAQHGFRPLPWCRVVGAGAAGRRS